MVRGAVQQAALIHLITGLSIDEALVIIDWACKILENDGQMKQEDWFGRAGDSDSGAAVFSHASATSTDIIITYIDLIFQDRIKQNATISHLALKSVISQVSQSLPFVRSVTVACDNGSGYHSGSLALFHFASSLIFFAGPSLLFLSFCCDSSILCLYVSFFLSFFLFSSSSFLLLTGTFVANVPSIKNSCGVLVARILYAESQDGKGMLVQLLIAMPGSCCCCCCCFAFLMLVLFS
jgi:hypothetical protein